MQTQPSSTPARSFTVWRLLGYILIAFAALITLTGLFYAEENWRGKHAWETYRQQAEARGVELDFRKLVPPRVPDDQNFAMTPFLAPVLDFNPRPFTTPWRDTNAANHAITFAVDFVAQFNELPVDQMTDLDGLAADVQKKLKPDNRANISTRDGAAAFLLDYMAQYQPVLDEIQTASKRPESRFNVHYDDKDPAGILLPHLAVVRRLAKLFQIKASAELTLGKTDSAFEDTRVIFRLGDSIRIESIVISQLVRNAILNSGKQVIWEGLNKHAWSDAQLQDFQTSLGALSILKDTHMALSAERAAFGVNIYDLMREDRKYMQNVIANEPGQPDGPVVMLSFAPRGWLYQEQVVHQKLLDEKLFPAFNADNTQIQPRTVDAFSTAVGTGTQSAATLLLHHHVLARLLIPSLATYCQKAAFCQANMDEALIACALERHRLANGNLPQTLAPLVPKYLAKLPVDICTGQPLKYHITDNGQFSLYSIGWNEKDDNGAIVMTQEKKPTQDLTQGDWAWPPYATK